jgi:hypothetical protein
MKKNGPDSRAELFSANVPGESKSLLSPNAALIVALVLVAALFAIYSPL